jgi:hypothetical protein
MIDPFESSKHCIAWAGEHHIPELERKVRAFFDSDDTYATFTDRDSKGRYNLLKLRLAKPLPRDLLGHTVDVISNLNAALDQAMHAVGGFYFPIRRTKTDFQDAMRSVRKHVPQEIAHLICAARPYKRGNKSLWALRNVCNSNKHGIIRPVVAISEGAGFSGRHMGSGRLQFPWPPRWNRRKNEMVLFRAPVTDTVEFDLNYQYASSIVFDNAEIIGGKPVIAVLNHFGSVVEGIVMAIEAEARRIGLF